MITKTIAAGIIAITALTAIPANAAGFSVQIGGGHGPNWGYHGGGQGWDRHQNWRHRVSTDEVRFMLRRDGYRGIRFFDNRGAVYQVRASKHGRDFFLVVSARTGEILSRQRI